MKDIKRLEIITDSLGTREVCAALKSCDVSGYTILHRATGSGDRGEQTGDELTDVFTNSCVITACAPGELSAIVEVIRPILKARGGVCLVSDAQWVVH